MSALSMEASVAAVKRKPGETAEHLAGRIAADNHSETEQGFSILRAIEEVELDLAEAVRLLREDFGEVHDHKRPEKQPGCWLCRVAVFLARVDAR